MREDREKLERKKRRAAERGEGLKPREVGVTVEYKDGERKETEV